MDATVCRGVQDYNTDANIADPKSDQPELASDVVPLDRQECA